MTAKRILVCALIVAVAAAGLSAQNRNSEGPRQSQAPVQTRENMQKRLQDLETRLNISDADLQRITSAVQPFNDQIRQASADVAVIRAQISRELIEAKPDLDKVKGLVRKSLDLELTVRMAEIQRQLAVRDILGDNRWLTLAEAIKQFRGPWMNMRERFPGMKLFDLLDRVEPRK